MESDKVRVNQVGYLRFASKIGVIVDSSTSPLEWQVQDSVGSVVLAGVSTPFGFDDASGDDVHQVDFSDVSDLGSYKLVVDGIGASLEFAIAPSLYPDLPLESMNYFARRPLVLVNLKKNALFKKARITSKQRIEIIHSFSLYERQAIQ